MGLISAGMKLTPTRLNNISPGWRKVVTIDQPNTANSNAFFNITELVASVDSGTVYRFGLYLKYTATTSADFKMLLVGPSGASLSDWRWWGMNAAGTETFGPAGAGGVTSLGGSGTGTPVTFIASGTVTTGGSAGTVQVQAGKQAAEASTLTIIKGSFFELEEIV